MSNNFIPLHITAKFEDMKGNNGKGRYLFVPGSDGRAKKIANFFDAPPILRESGRGHNLYMGTITKYNKKLDFGVISTGMGAPSVDIIVSELLLLGGKNFLRLGTSGMLQPKFMKAGDLAVATGAVKDEGTTKAYVPVECPAIASIDMINAAINAASNLNYSEKLHVGIFHTKDSLYAREFKTGPMKEENTRYMNILKETGVIASEMEASMLFTLAGIYNKKTSYDIGKMKHNHIKAGAICCILGEEDDFGAKDAVEKMTEEMIKLGIETYFELDKSLNV